MPRFEEVERILGSDYLEARAAASAAEGSVATIAAAAAVFLARCPRVDLAEYKMSVCREGELLHVIFVDKQRRPGMRGSGGRRGCPVFEVTLQGADLAVVDAHFVR